MNLQETIRRILREEVNKFSKESTMSDLITMMGTSRIREGNRIEIVDDRLIKYESTFGINIDYLDRKTLHVINSFMNERGWFPTNIKLENERESKRYSKNVKHYLGKKNVVINYESTSNNEINLNTKTAYHVTTDRYLNSILTNGLTPRTESKLSDHPERIYLFQDKESQNSMARALFNSLSDDQKKMIKKYVVLEIDLTKIPNHKFYADPQASISYGAIFTTQSIPKFAIRKINEIDTSNLTPYTESEPVELEFAQTSPEMIKRYGEIDDKLKKIGDDKLNMSWDDLMNLQEQISRIQSINETIFFRRRINLDKVKELLKLHAEQVFYETESYNRFKYELTLRAVEAAIWQDFGLGWEDLPEEEEIEFVTDVSNHFDKEIKKLYKNYRR